MFKADKRSVTKTIDHQTIIKTIDHLLST